MENTAITKEEFTSGQIFKYRNDKNIWYSEGDKLGNVNLKDPDGILPDASFAIKEITDEIIAFWTFFDNELGYVNIPFAYLTK